MVSRVLIIEVVFVLLGTGCGIRINSPAITPSLIPAPELLLDAHPFPEGWEIDPCNPDRCLRGSHARRYFGRVGIPGSAIQHVYRFASVQAAQAKFRRVREVAFNKGRNEPSTEFLPPSEITYHSPIADEFYLGCGVDIVPACEAIFRYGIYYVQFFFNVDRGYVDGVEIKGDGLKIKEVEPILRTMDTRAASVLGIPLPTKAP